MFCTPSRRSGGEKESNAKLGSKMSAEELQAVVGIREALLAIAHGLRELVDAVDRITKAIEQAAEEVRDVRP